MAKNKTASEKAIDAIDEELERLEDRKEDLEEARDRIKPKKAKTYGDPIAYTN